MFEVAYQKFMAFHAKQRKGESLRRLKEGHGHAEKMLLQNLWWPAIGHFDDLYPEFEVRDYRDGYRYLDYAFIPSSFLRLNIEVDGYGPHLKNISRSQFSDNLIRQNHLVIDGWKVLRFSFDDIMERSRMCQQLLQQFLGKYIEGIHRNSAKPPFSPVEKEILRLAMRLHRHLYPQDVCHLLNVEKQKARKLLHSLLEKGPLKPAGNGLHRVYCYRLNETFNFEQLDAW